MSGAQRLGPRCASRTRKPRLNTHVTALPRRGAGREGSGTPAKASEKTSKKLKMVDNNCFDSKASQEMLSPRGAEDYEKRKRTVVKL